MLAFAVLNEGFGRDLAGRSNTALNLMMFGGSFLAQWGIGVIAETAQRGFTLDQAGGLRAAFGLVLFGNVVTFAWFARGWRRVRDARGTGDLHAPAHPRHLRHVHGRHRGDREERRP